ncbi:MAG: epoxyqueuosine reductase QueH [Nitrospirota bacterium]
MNVFIHICCAPCVLFPYFHLKDEGYTLTGFFYNPNIHPFQEYTRRVDTLKDFASRVGFSVLYQHEFDLDSFFLQAAGKGTHRCEACYRMRLSTAAATARKQGADAFTSSLLYSKYQKHDCIAAIGQEMAEEYGIRFLYEDFRKGWREGIVESKAMGLYRQSYCGCVYSEWERYQKKREAQG